LDLSVIIVNWNTSELLRNCLASVYEQTVDLDYEVIVVDNASTDSSLKMLKSDFPQVVLIENEENRGFAAANNQAIAVTKGRYILLLNSDTVILDRAIERTISFANENPKAGAIGCKVLNPDGTIQHSCFMFPSILNMLLSSTYLYKIFPKNKLFGREQMTWWDRNDVREVDVIKGCFMLVRREAIEQVGILDEHFFVYGEETDWCYRLKKEGWKVMFTPIGQVIHFGGQSTQQSKVEMILQLRGSILLFIKKHKGFLSQVITRLLTALFFFLRVPYWITVGMFRKGKRSESISTAATYWLGGIHCLVNWKKLLINKVEIEGGVSPDK
jgi:GT2 family glycosyltransferase